MERLGRRIDLRATGFDSMPSLYRSSAGISRSIVPESPLWNPATGKFDVPRLRLALVKRYLTPEEFAHRVGVGRSSLYKAPKGEGVRDRTAMIILRGLARIKPVMPTIVE